MKLEVECYTGRTADERPVRFHLDGHAYMLEDLLDQWYGPSDNFSRFAPMTAISIFCVGKLPCPRALGIWSHSGR